MDCTCPIAISFDLWGTLIGSHPDFKAERNELLRRRLAPTVALDLFTATLRAADRDADEESLRTGHDLGLLPRVEAALGRLGIRTTIAPETALAIGDEQRRAAVARPPRPLHPDLPSRLSQLAEAVPLAITSNTGMLPGSLMRELLHKQGMLDCFTVQTFSDEVEVAKPFPAIFQRTLAGLGVHDPARVLHVGDNPRADIQGAAFAGMATALVTRGDTAADLISSLLASTEVRA